MLAVAACLFYVFVYTLWLKRTSSRNIVIGGAAGAVPVLVGWSSVTGTLDWAPVVLFAIIFYWTPPHFWALAIRYRDDYAAADVPMLPVVESLRRTVGPDPRATRCCCGPSPALLAGGGHGPPLPRVGGRPRRDLHLVRRPAAPQPDPGLGVTSPAAS